MRMYILEGGFITMEKSFLTAARDFGKQYSIPIYYTFIDHPDAKIIYDTGFDIQSNFWKAVPNPITSEVKQTVEERLDSQLLKLGLSLDQIDYVIMSHLHCDHTGYLKLFNNKRANILVQRLELKEAYVPEPFDCRSYIREDFDLGGLKYQPIDGIFKVVDGVEILPTPGHSPGHQSLILRLEKTGPIILTGDAAYMKESLDNSILSVAVYNPVDMIRSMNKIKEFALKEKGKIFFSHDNEFYKGLKKAPEFYD